MKYEWKLVLAARLARWLLKRGRQLETYTTKTVKTVKREKLSELQLFLLLTKGKTYNYFDTHYSRTIPLLVFTYNDVCNVTYSVAGEAGPPTHSATFSQLYDYMRTSSYLEHGYIELANEQ